MTDAFDAGNLDDNAPLLPERKVTSRKADKADKGSKDEKRVRIVLEDNDQVPPGGQFVQANGRSFLLQTGVPIDVPVCVIDVLDHAVHSVPVTDAMHTVVGYKDRLRFPYRVLTSTRTAD